VIFKQFPALGSFGKFLADEENFLIRNPLILKGYSKFDYTASYFSLRPQLFEKMPKLAVQAKIRESYILRDILDKFF
jgi:hypothetical protein